MQEKVANTDTTYCINEHCKNKCWRYKDNWYFEKDTNYWFMEKCDKTYKKSLEKCERKD